ncbi:MAG: beta-propeller domain-containing protein [Acidimicrobiia bacterium]|nr:beta-propeller domain-containing protein [Acidimicrobiia bacterium]
MNLRRFSRFAPVLLAGALGTAACTTGVDTTGGGGDPDGRAPSIDLSTDEILLTSGLQTVDSCGVLLERIKDEAIERVGPYGFDIGGPIFLEDDIVFAEEAAAGDDAGVPASTSDRGLASADAAEASTAARGGAGAEYSETNNQEQGVDEADLVKTDGNRLVVVSGATLRIIDVTGSTPRLVDTIQLPDELWGGQLFLDGDRALLMTSGWTDQPFFERSIASDWYPGSPTGRLIEIDLERGRIGRTFEFEGSYLSAREIDGSIRIVLTASASRFAFVYPSNEGAEESAERANRQLIEESTIEQWIPTYRITEGGETVEEGALVECDRVHLPAEFAGFGSLVVLTADLDRGLDISDSLSVFTDAQTVYASTDRLAVATPRWPHYGPDGELDEDENDYSTALHTFDITDPERAGYVASGSVRGHLLNQFSLSEYDGYLRVATTDGNPWWGGGGREQTESYVTVLAEDGNVLREVGQVGGLGRGEQIFAVRFLGDVGYVVTFEQIDPLYALDLSDPSDPRVLGELKIPGFSSYLHPVGEEHLLGIGTDGDEDGFTSGAVISLFDVSDLSDPTRVAKLNFDQAIELREGSSYTPVSHDAKAFTFWDDVAIVPVSWWDYNPEDGTERNGSEAVLVAVDLDGELIELGRVSHPVTRECESGIYIEERPVETTPEGGDGDSGDAEASFVEPDDVEEPAVVAPAPDEYCYTFAPEIQRSIIIDGDLYTVSPAGVGVNDFNSLRDVAWIPFEQR